MHTLLSTTVRKTVSLTAAAALLLGSFAGYATIAQANSPSDVTVTIDGFVNGQMATATSADNSSFPMNATWNATNTGAGSGSFTLGPTGFNSPNPYEAVTTQMTSGADYSVSADTSGSVVGADCSTGAPYRLVGYTSGTSFADAASSTPTMTAPSFTGMTSNEYVIVWDAMCVPTPMLIAPANGSATTTAGQTSVSWSSVSDTAGGITYVYQASNASTTNADGSFTTPIYTSGALSTMTLATSGTPDGTYYWHVQATDAAGNMSSWSAPWSFTVSNSSSATTTVISNVAVGDVTDTGATVTWNTDQDASSQVLYGTSSSYTSSTTLDATASSTHSAALTGLSANTLYHFQVQSSNANGLATSSDQTFTTASSTVGTTTPLALTGIDTVSGTATADGSFNDGWEWVFHFTVPTDETQFALKFSDFTNANSTIAVANNVRYYSAQSTNATSSASAVMVTGANCYPATMLNLDGDTATSTDGRQIDVVVQMAIPGGTAAGTYSASWNAESTTTASTTP